MNKDSTRDYILLYVNGREHRVAAARAFVPLTEYLRFDLALCGTKVVCSEGDCGACTVIHGRFDKETGTIDYKAVNACILYVFQLDCTHVITIEGLANSDSPNPVQKSMVECHGAQCGFCTPGIVMAMTAGMLQRCSENKEACPSRESIKEDLSGNLCRCTGYDSIIEAGLAVEPDVLTDLDTLYPPAPLLESFAQAAKSSVSIRSSEHSLFLPRSLEAAAAYKGENLDSIIINGGTDLAVSMNKRQEVPAKVLALSNVEEACGIEELERNGRLVLAVGCRVALSTLEQRIKELNPELYYILWVFGSPQIRNAGTLAGNIANGSPIADSLPYLFVMAAEIEVVSPGGRTRLIPITELYVGYKQLSLVPGELISRIFLPMPKDDEILKLYKISRRQHLDISSFTAAFLLRVSEEGSKRFVDTAKVAYGGVGPVVTRMTELEAFLAGKEFSLSTFVEAGKVAAGEVAPISDVRGSRQYRAQLAQSILLKLYHETEAEEVLACL